MKLIEECWTVTKQLFAEGPRIVVRNRKELTWAVFWSAVVVVNVIIPLMLFARLPFDHREQAEFWWRGEDIFVFLKQHAFWLALVLSFYAFEFLVVKSYLSPDGAIQRLVWRLRMKDVI